MASDKLSEAARADLLKKLPPELRMWVRELTEEMASHMSMANISQRFGEFSREQLDTFYCLLRDVYCAANYETNIRPSRQSKPPAAKPRCKAGK